MNIHPIANELPPLSKEECDALRDDIDKNGQLVPVLVDEQGYIIDGRHRAAACRELGIEVKTELFTGTDAQKRALSNSLNCIRRHLTPSQQAHRVSADTTVKHGSNQHKAKEDLQICRSSTVQEVTVSEASRLSGVSERLIGYGKRVRENGIKQLNDAVKNGKVALHVAARVAKLERSEQRAFIANGCKLPSVPRAPKATVIVEPAETITVQPEEQKPTQTDAEKVRALLAEALELMKAVDRSSEEMKAITELVGLFNAAPCSCCCDQKPVEIEEPRALTHVEILERHTVSIKGEISELKRVEGWADTKERCAAVRTFMKTYRKLGNEFEKYTTVGAEPNKTLFESDADIPEHLNTQEFLAAWNSWWAHRKQRKLSVSDVTKKRQLNLLAFGDAAQAAAIVSKAEENKWQGIPDSIWIPSRNCGLWCDRMPAHASADLNAKIQAALPNVTANGSKTILPVKVNRGTWGARNSPEFEAMSVEEQRRAMLADR